MKSPRILYLCPYWPREKPSFGGEWRALQLGLTLCKLGPVQTVIVPNRPYDKEYPTEVNPELNVIYAVKIIPPVKIGLGWKLNQARRLLDSRMLYPYGAKADEAGNRFVLSRIGNFDLVWIGHFFTPHLFGRFKWPQSVLDVDDVPSLIERSELQMLPTLPGRLNRAVRISCFRRREKAVGDRFTVVTVCSDADKEYLQRIGCRGPIHVIPNGFMPPQSDPTRNPAVPPRIGFVGPFHHKPNLEGIRWFVLECWPRIKQVLRDTRLRIVGEGSEGALKPIGQDIDGLGWVPNIEAEISTWSLMIVPVRMGGGTRVKVAQAFSLKCPCVSTTVGAYGFNVTDGAELLIADTAEQFTNACIRIIGQPVEANELAARARNRFLSELTWEAIAPRVNAAAEDCLRRSTEK